MTAKDHVKAIEKYCGRPTDHIVVNNQPIPETVKDSYKKEGEYPVEDNLADDKRVTRAALLAESNFEKPKSDSLKRSLLRHDPKKLAETIIKITN
jgi:2-phospho-L-lactate transferase/gluconeogenesis factor (CofD/UPF0052 family)